MREVGKLERASDQSPESGWIRTWLDTVLELPWNERTEDATDIGAAREVLDADHHGLTDVKDRIVEYLAVRSRRARRGMSVVGGRGSGAVLALVGPPGVGKTSLGESVARALGRKFVRVALGGVRDEAEIRGHRRTYVGALPGRIVRAIGEAGSMNPVVLLDEIDKVGADYRGDPAAALLEVLDPAQNHTFRDHYLDLDLDLSDVLFLATANVMDTIPGPLLDRMEIITLDGYTEDDKVAIARTHLLPRQQDRAALETEEVTVTDDALREIVASHTREAGVRQLERLLAKVFRKVATQLESTDGPVTVDVGDLRGLLGRPRFTPETAERTAAPGVATGLAVTGLGGDVLFIEASSVVQTEQRRRRAGGLTLTGQLGDVMKESAQIALSYVRSHAEAVGVDPLHPGPADPPARAGRCRAQGRPVRRRHHGDGIGLHGHRSTGPLGRGHDRRGHAERPGAADRWGQAEAAGGAAGRSEAGLHPAAQRAGPGRRAGRDPGRAGGPPGRRCRGDPGRGIGAGTGAGRRRGRPRRRLRLPIRITARGSDGPLPGHPILRRRIRIPGPF